MLFGQGGGGSGGPLFGQSSGVGLGLGGTSFGAAFGTAQPEVPYRIQGYDFMSISMHPQFRK